MATDASPSLVTALITLLSVVVGGVLTGWFGPSLLERRKEAAEKNKRRAEKFEELVAAVYELDHWVESKARIDAYGEEGVIGVSPSAKLNAISAVYFPQFGKQIGELDFALLGYHAWIAATAAKRVTGDIQGMQEGRKEAYVPYLKAKEALLNELKDFARAEFQ